MRIGLFTDAYLPYVSGVVTAVDTLRIALEKEGHKVFIITINPDRRIRYKKEGNVIRIPGIPSNINKMNIRIGYPFRAVKMVKDLNLDIIHCHTEFGIGLFGKSIAKKFNIPYVQTLHTMYEDAIGYITKGLFPRLSNRATIKLTKIYYNDSYLDEIIVPGEKVKKLLKNKKRKKNNVTVIPNGIELKDFYKENVSSKQIKKIKSKLDIKENDFVILWVGRLGYEKNIDLLVANHKKIVEKYPNAKLLIVGGGPHEQRLKDIAKKNKIQDKVIFTGMIKHTDVPAYFHVGDVFATASNFETQGLTLIESLAADTPVICIKDDSFTDIVINNKNGLVFKNANEYVKCVLSLIKDKNKLKELKNNSRTSVDKYSMEEFAKKTLTIYEKAIKEHYAK